MSSTHLTRVRNQFLYKFVIVVSNEAFVYVTSLSKHFCFRLNCFGCFSFVCIVCRFSCVGLWNLECRWSSKSHLEFLDFDLTFGNDMDQIMKKTDSLSIVGEHMKTTNPCMYCEQPKTTDQTVQHCNEFMFDRMNHYVQNTRIEFGNCFRHEYVPVWIPL